MTSKKFSRRDFLRMSGLAAAGAALAGCSCPSGDGGEATEVPMVDATDVPAMEPVTLDFVATLPEYDSQYQQIMALYMAENPHVTVEVTSHSEDGNVAYGQKVAGGYVPAVESAGAGWPSGFTASGQDFVDAYLNIGDLDFPWFDRWTYDVQNFHPDIYDIPGPHCLQQLAGFIFSWMYHKDLMDELIPGFDRTSITTWDELKAFLAQGTEAVAARDDIDYFWDQGWNNWNFSGPNPEAIMLAFADGKREMEQACWLGEKKFNDADSPYRHGFEFYLEAYQEGWIPEEFWAREWEPDMEASYASKKSVLMLHGPWPWDKTITEDPTAVQEGFPATPPAEGNDEWLNMRWPVDPQQGWGMRKGVEETEWFDEAKKLFYWWFSPATVKAYGEALSWPVAYTTDEPLELEGPQWKGVYKEIGTEDGLWPDVKFEDRPFGSTLVAGSLKKGAPGVWDVESGGLTVIWRDVVTEEITVQEALDILQENYEESYEL